jgi:NAD(P)-dependent dehydrogenase (short-subunit alcohol dehydrogenase family)
MSHAVVVGGSGAFGRALMRRLRADHAAVSCLSRSPGEDPAEHVPCDVTSEASVAAAVAEAEDRSGPIDVCVYTAGSPVMGAALAVPLDAARASFEANFWGLERLARVVTPRMVERRRGAFGAVLSIAALRAIPYEAHYGAAKAAAARYLECLRLELEPSGVRVRYLAPGYVATGFLERGGWFGLEPPVVHGSGVTADDVAAAIVRQLHAHGTGAVFGVRERAIALADRVAPGLYDHVLARRMRGT